MKNSRAILFAFILLNTGLVFSCQKKERYYTVEDFENVPKIDAHFHYLTTNEDFIEFAAAENFKLISPTWDGEYSFKEQLKIAESIREKHSETFAFMGTFSVEDYGKKDFADHIIAQIADCISKGAAGVKIWKNIGMLLQDSAGRYVMIDDPAFDPVFAYLEDKHIPLIAHLGEPRDCWLPFDEMTDPSDVYYYKHHPQYYMYMHPEVPTYEEQIAARDHILEKYPDLYFVGAHLGSLEWSIDELAKRFDSYPNFKVDLAARIYHLQYQSDADWDKVRDFIIKYQDRFLYATDDEVHDIEGSDPQHAMEGLKRGWLSQWIYFATDSTQKVKGLKLPAEVIDKLYYKNASYFFNKN